MSRLDQVHVFRRIPPKRTYLARLSAFRRNRVTSLRKPDACRVLATCGRSAGAKEHGRLQRFCVSPAAAGISAGGRPRAREKDKPGHAQVGPIFPRTRSALRLRRSIGSRCRARRRARRARPDPRRRGGLVEKGGPLKRRLLLFAAVALAGLALFVAFGVASPPRE